MPWPSLNYSDWSETCDTLHGHTQLLGKLCVKVAPAEPELQHAALRITARGWETQPLPCPDGSGSFVVALDLHAHAAVIEHSSGTRRSIPLTPNRSVGGVTRDVLHAIEALAGRVEIDPTPQEVWWTVPLDEDEEHHTFDEHQVAQYHACATQAGLALADFRAPYRGRKTPVNAWWGSFDLAVSLFSGQPADPPSQDFIMRNSMDAQEVAIGWWPGAPQYPKSAFYGYAHPAPEGYSDGPIKPDEARWDTTFGGQFVLDWDDVIATPDPHATVVEFAHSLFAYSCEACSWDPALAATAAGVPPPVN